MMRQRQAFALPTLVLVITLSVILAVNILVAMIPLRVPAIGHCYRTDSGTFPHYPTLVEIACP